MLDGEHKRARDQTRNGGNAWTTSIPFSLSQHHNSDSSSSSSFFMNRDDHTSQVQLPPDSAVFSFVLVISATSPQFWSKTSCLPNGRKAKNAFCALPTRLSTNRDDEERQFIAYIMRLEVYLRFWHADSLRISRMRNSQYRLHQINV